MCDLRGMKIPVISIAALCLSAVASTAHAQAPMGYGKAIDGDTLMVGDQEVRLFGIDAPEFHQNCKRNGESWACGADAADLLARLVNGKQVFCQSMGTDRYGRVLGRCVAGTTDLNRVMVSNGYAVAYRRYSVDYISVEASAQAAKRGIWAGTFETPEQYRHPSEVAPKRRIVERRQYTQRPSQSWSGPTQGNCNIKGNRNRKGQWIYHLPGMPYYDQTRPEEIFCTEAEAQAAGYRRAIVR